jgi:hypothetical protein
VRIQALCRSPCVLTYVVTNRQNFPAFNGYGESY